MIFYYRYLALTAFGSKLKKEKLGKQVYGRAQRNFLDEGLNRSKQYLPFLFSTVHR